MTSFEPTSSRVDFSVGTQVAAATSHPKRLELLAEGAILSYYQRSYKAYPRSDQYTIAQTKGSCLLIDSTEKGIAEAVSEALLDAPRGARSIRRSIDRWPPPTTPYWGAYTLAMTIFAVVISAFAVTSAWLVFIALGAAAGGAAALVMAKRGGASLSKTVLGIFPSIIVVGFAVYYGFVMLTQHPSVTVPATKTPHLVDAFLLSLGMASTAGFFDMSLNTTAVRVIAFCEMLLMVSVAGGSLYAGARAAWNRLIDVVSINNPG